MDLRIPDVNRQVIGRQMRVSAHHALGLPAAQLVQREERCAVNRQPHSTSIGTTTDGSLRHERTENGSRFNAC